MKWTALINAAGLCLAIIGAFLLAVEAIGLDRIRQWRDEQLNGMREIVATKGTAKMTVVARERGMPRLPGRLVGCGSGVGAGIPTALMLALTAAEWPTKSTALPVAITVGAIAGYFILDAVALALTLSVRLLVTVEDYTRRGIVGVIGFTFLLVGFSIQILVSLATFFLT